MSIADLLIHEVPLSPREAATLTLAVARELDRARALRGIVALPDPGAIVLDRLGTITFLLSPRLSHLDDARSLSSLLTMLLRVDGDPAARERVPDGLLLAINGRAGDTELPSSIGDGFRAALAPFADPEAAVLPAIYLRAIRMIATTGAPSDAELIAHRLARVERRRTGPSASELRRDMRLLERRLFEASQQHRSLDSAASSQRGPLWWISAGAIAMVLAILPLTTRSSIAEPVSGVAANGLSNRDEAKTERDRPADTITATQTSETAHTRRLSPSLSAADSGAPRGQRVASPVPSRAVVIPVATVRRPPSRRRVTLATRPSYAATVSPFVGGTRGVAWLTPAR